jgi:glycosyltransferase involved in cell wall biosynthesis
MWPHKNHERLVEAFARLHDPDLELVLIGQTYDRLKGVLDVARRAGAGERVRHLGYVDTGSIPALYRTARALVFPSLYEGFGGPPLEAMACGCPVASSLRSPLAEICEGAAGARSSEHRVDRHSNRACHDRRAAPRRTDHAGLERAQEFSWEEAAARHTEVYAGALARHEHGKHG